MTTQHKPSSEAGEAWRPIETAPNSGTFLIYWKKPDKTNVIRIATALNGWIGYGDFYVHRAFEATHWMPLPEPPKGTTP